MIARWRLQLLAELSVGTLVRAAQAEGNAGVDRLRSAIHGHS